MTRTGLHRKYLTFLVQKFSLTISQNLVTLFRKKPWTDFFGWKREKNSVSYNSVDYKNQAIVDQCDWLRIVSFGLGQCFVCLHFQWAKRYPISRWNVTHVRTTITITSTDESHLLAIYVNCSSRKIFFSALCTYSLRWDKRSYLDIL